MRLQGAADARRRACSRAVVLQVSGNAADVVPCERILHFSCFHSRTRALTRARARARGMLLSNAPRAYLDDSFFILVLNAKPLFEILPWLLLTFRTFMPLLLPLKCLGPPRIAGFPGADGLSTAGVASRSVNQSAICRESSFCH